MIDVHLSQIRSVHVQCYCSTYLLEWRRCRHALVAFRTEDVTNFMLPCHINITSFIHKAGVLVDVMTSLSRSKPVYICRKL